uniref:Putative methyltransferase n=2 Tax=viral metagenome TaxID=1070528 RepID=A0A6M3KR33_9ZZZZ
MGRRLTPKGEGEMKGKGNDGRGDNQDRDLWQTEQGFWDLLNAQYAFRFDCCASEQNKKTQQFSGNFESVHSVNMGWMNPPFSKAMAMFKHFFNVVKSGVAIYRFDNPETKIWQEVIFPNASWVFIPSGRVSYTPFDITIRGGLTRFPSALIGLNVEPPKSIKGFVLTAQRIGDNL